LASRRQALARQHAALDQLNERRNQLVADETRLRDNLSALGREASLRKRLLDSFAATESTIETVTAEIGKASAAVDAAERDLSAYIAGLNL
jgi:ABC-type transporter Mla subunit MlaD